MKIGVPEIIRRERPKRLGPLKRRDARVGHVCPACHQPLRVGQYFAAVVFGPGDNPEARQLARAGRWYPGVGEFVHFACATGEEDDH